MINRIEKENRTATGKEQGMTEFEKRISRDDDGFYQVQIRMLAVEEWQPMEGWGTVFITSIYENAKERLGHEPGTEVEA